MDFCGRCGHELSRGPERGRFCATCGHETRGNARYPLYADGTPAVTRPRPASVSPGATATAVAPAVRAARPAVSVPPPADETRRRVPVLLADLPAAVPAPPAIWRVTLAATLATLLVVVLLGLVLLLS
jgi:hypothetical protein